MIEWRRWLVGLSAVLGLLAVEIQRNWLAAEFLTTAGSMLLSLAVYAFAFGWQFSAGFIFLLLAHEWGHILAIRLLRLGFRGPLFIPFLGAVVQLRRSPRSIRGDAGIAIAGPALGTLSALLCLVLYLWIDAKIWLVLAYTGCMLNLFNLIPCSPLDGGRIAPAILPKLWLAGILGMALLLLKTGNPFLLLIILIALLRMRNERNDNLPDEYFFIAPFMRFKIALWYFTLLAVLSVATVFTHQLLQ